jgi:hypothetical protein
LETGWDIGRLGPEKTRQFTASGQCLARIDRDHIRNPAAEKGLGHGSTDDIGPDNSLPSGEWFKMPVRSQYCPAVQLHE